MVKSLKISCLSLYLLIGFVLANGGLFLSVQTAYGQTSADVIKASGGTELSIDSVATQGFTTIDGPTIRETASGQLAQGGTIILTLPSGFVWNDNLVPEDITLTIVGTGANNTKLDVQIGSIATDKVTLNVLTASTTNGNGQGPGRVEIRGLQLRPNTTNVPTTGNIENTGTTGPGSDGSFVNYGDLSTAVGAISKVQVETKNDGTGQVVPAQDITAGETITVYAIGRDIGDNFIKNVALTSAGDWTLVNTSGSIQQAAISASADLKSASFSSLKTGTAKIKALYSGASSITSETLTVLPRDAQKMVINTQPSATATAGQAFSTQPVIFLEDQFGNKVTTDNSTQITASLENGDGALSGTTTQTASGGEINFTDLYATIADSITLKFNHSTIDSVISNEIIITPSNASDLEYSQQPSNTAQNNTISPPVELQLLDQYGNNVKTAGKTVSINSESFLKNSSTLSVDTDTNGIAIFNNLNIKNTATKGSVTLTSQFTGINAPVTSNSFQIIGADELAEFDITTTNGNDIGQQQAGSSFDIKITALDGTGSNFTFSANRTVTITSDGDIQKNGSPLNSFDVEIPSGSSSVTTSLSITTSGTTKIYADQGQSISGTSNNFNVNPTNTIDETKSVITAQPTEIIADGSSTSKITVQLKDEFGNNIKQGGETVELTTSAGTFNGGVSTIVANDEGDGTYTAVLTSSTDANENATITGSVNGQTIGNNTTVNFIAGEIATFTFELPQNNGAPATQTAGVPFEIDVYAIDEQGNIVSDFNGPVTFSSTSNITSGSTANFSNGTLGNHSLTITTADSNTTITATADNLYNISGISSSFDVVANVPDASNSSVIATPTVLQTQENSESSLAIILRDAYQNRVYQEYDVTLALKQLEENNSTSTDGNAEAYLINGANGTDIPFNATKGIYRDTLINTSTVEKVEITAFFGNAPSTQINQTAIIDIVIPNIWTAGAGGPPSNRTEWTNPDNWTSGVPQPDDFVIIPDVGDVPVLDLNLDLGSLQVDSNVSLTLFGGNAINVSGNTTLNGSLNIEDNTEFTVGGNLEGAGSFSGQKSTTIDIKGDISLSAFNVRTTGSQITLNGDSPQSISTTNFLAQNLNIKNNVEVNSSSNLIDTSTLTIDDGHTLELNAGANTTLDVAQKIEGNGSLLINDNTLVLGGDIDLSNIDATQGTVVFGVRQGQNPANFNLAEQQILTLSAMKNTVINNDHNVRVFEDVVVDGSLTLENGELIINSGKSLIAPNQVYNNGALQIRRNISSEPGWRMISAPINTSFADLFEELTTQGISGSTYPNRQPNILYYNETISGTDNQRLRAPNAMSDLIQDPDSTGRGFFFFVFGDVSGDSDYNDTLPVTLSISGKEYQHSSSSFNFSSVTYTASADSGWNLVGNPWAATIDWDNNNWTKTNMDNVIYVWDPASNSYLTWNGVDGSLGNGLIKPFQAFWVKANGENPTLSIDKTAKTTGGQFYGKSDKEPASIGFTLEADSLVSQMYITLSPDGKQSKDFRDAFWLLPFDTDSYLEFYSTLDDGTQLSVNNLAREFGKEIEIPLYIGGYKNGVPLNGEYTISWPDFGKVPDSWTLLLEDKKSNKKIDLRKQTFYSFNLSQNKSKTAVRNTINTFQLVEKTQTRAKTKTNIDNRFILHIKPGADAAGIPDEYSLGINYPNPFSSKTTIKYNTPVEGKVKITIFDILGRKVETLLDERKPADFHEIDWSPNHLASGVYICVLQAGDKQFSKKITYIKQ